MVIGTNIEKNESNPADFDNAISHTGNINIYNYLRVCMCV